MEIILLAYLPPLFGMLAILYLVFMRRSQSRLVYDIFCWMLLFIILWLSAQLASLLLPNESALIALQASFVFSSFMLGTLVLFAATYPSIKKLPSTARLVVLFLPAVVFSLLSASSLVYVSVVNDGIYQTVLTGEIYDVQGLYLFIYSLFAVYLLSRKVSVLRGSTKQGVLVLLISFAVPVAINVTVNYVFRLDQTLVQYFWPVSFFIMTALIAYAMIRHRLFDIRLVFVRALAYAFVLVALSTIYYLLAYLVSITLFKGEVTSSFGISPLNIFLALILAFIFQPIKRFFDKITNSIFYRDSYNSDEFFARLSGVLTSTTDLRTLLERAAYEISKTLKADQAFFFVYHMGEHHISAGTEHHNHLPVQDARELDKYVQTHGDSAIVTDLLADDHAIQRLLQSHKIAVLLPLNRRDRQIIGYLALGEQKSTGYTNSDVKVLATISDELVIAIQNSLSVQEVRDINTHLQQRIEAATHELRSSNAQLRHLDTTKDEFLSMASHQLRTPLTSVKGYISMVLEGDAGKITDMQKHLLGEAFSSSERMVHLIHDFLNVSRLQTGKFMLEQHPYDLVSLVKQEVDSLRRNADARQMKLQFISQSKELLLNIDENKIRQVVMNFVDNSLFYSHEDTTITIELIEENDTVELRVNDTGIGVPKSEQAQLFSKFYRASNARKQRPDGTGVGLYLAKKVISEHGGDVLFESTEGKGSTFGFSLPLAKLRIVESTDNAD